VTNAEIEALCQWIEEGASCGLLGDDASLAAAKLQQSLTAIRQLQQPWQGMESAPKDGTWIITTDGKDVTPGCWADDSPEYGSGDVGWCFGDERWGGVLYEGINLMDPQPTHWTPLPHAPEPGQ
jgi:hypothetical protein